MHVGARLTAHAMSVLAPQPISQGRKRRVTGDVAAFAALLDSDGDEDADVAPDREWETRVPLKHRGPPRCGSADRLRMATDSCGTTCRLRGV